jgi:hypothetical protein
VRAPENADVFAGSIVRTVMQNTWPFTHGQCFVETDVVTLRLVDKTWNPATWDG